MSRSPREVGSARRFISTLGLMAAVLAAVPAFAAKWRHCPDQLGYYPSRLGAVSAPFVHPGHELGIFLNAREAASTGGFSTAPEGNEIRVVFQSLFGAPIALASRWAAAVSPTTLYFTFPDTQNELGRALAGPVEVTVLTGTQTTADIAPRQLVGLPPPTDVGAIVAGAVQQRALGTMDSHGAIWVPVQFSAFGTMQKPMMMCPGTFTPRRAFGVGVTVRSQPSFVIGAPPAYPPFRALRKVDVFLGDFLVNGTNFYGTSVGKLTVFRVPRGWGIKVCALNDAVDLVLRAPGWGRWARPWSTFGDWMPSSTPLAIMLSQVTAGPDDQTGLDAFGEECIR